MSVSAHIFCVRYPGAGVIDDCELSCGFDMFVTIAWAEYDLYTVTQKISTHYQGGGKPVTQKISTHYQGGGKLPTRFSSQL